jgi:hypothetical protein
MDYNEFYKTLSGDMRRARNHLFSSFGNTRICPAEAIDTLGDIMERSKPNHRPTALFNQLIRKKAVLPDKDNPGFIYIPKISGTVFVEDDITQ